MNDFFQTLGLSIEQIVNTIRQIGTNDKIAELSVYIKLLKHKGLILSIT